jgi:hypothetical protein
MFLKRCINLTRKQMLLPSQMVKLTQSRAFRYSPILSNEQQLPQSTINTEDLTTLGSIRRPRKTNTKYMNGLPIDGNGVISLPQQPPRPIIEHFYSHRGIESSLVFDILTEHFFSFIDALCSGDEIKVRAMAEKRFGDRLAANLKHVEKNKIQFQRGKGLVPIVKDQTDYGQLR